MNNNIKRTDDISTEVEDLKKQIRKLQNEIDNKLLNRKNLEEANRKEVNTIKELDMTLNTIRTLIDTVYVGPNGDISKVGIKFIFIFKLNTG